MIKFCLSLFFLLMVKTIFAQSESIISQSRFYQVENPSAFGLNFTNKVGVLYNTSTIDQENKLDDKYFFGALAFRDQNFSLGFDLNSYKIQNVDLVSTQARMNFVYVVQLSSSTYFLPAISLGYHNVSVNIPSFIFEDQINQTTGFISSETIDPLGQSIGRISYPDLTASFLVHSSTFFAGLTFFHLNQPNISLDKEGDEKQAFELSFQGGTEIDLNPYQRGFLPDNSFLFLYNSVRFLEQNTLFNFTQEVLFSSFFLSLNQRLSFSNATNINSIGFGMGIALENFDFGIQFNAPLRKINQVFAPSVFELYFSFDFSPFRRNNRGVYKRLQIDNY